MYWKCEDCGDQCVDGCRQCELCAWRYRRIDNALRAAITTEEQLELDLLELRRMKACKPRTPFDIQAFRVDRLRQTLTGGGRVIRKPLSP